MAFSTLQDKLQAIFDRLGKRGILTEQDVDAALREVRVALLEADVNFKVAKEFLARVRERAVGAEVHKSLTPGQAVVKIVHEELLRTLGEGGKLDLGGPPPRVIMLVGLQGSGKTTTAAKLALRLRNDGRKPLLVAADTYRPAAITQLETLGKQINIPVFSEGDKVPPPQIAQHAIQKAIQSALDVVIIDTAGRLQIDEAMMREVEEVKARTRPAEVLLIADAMTGQEAVNYTLRTPVGVAGCISPWNLPLYLFTWKIAPALAAGCTVVAKPSELTPMTAFLFSQLCIEAGLPKGVLNIVHGLGPKAGQAIVEHPGIPAISFTGGTVTGKKIAATAAPMFKKLSLELGGKNPNIVFSDCNFEKAVRTSVQAAFSNQGEICLCGSRIFVERSVYDRFVTEFVKLTRELVVGDPLEEKTRVGALVSEAHLKKVLAYIALAQEEGGKIVTGGKRVNLSGRCSSGYFVEPTVITGLNEKCRTNQEEIFGPVVTVMPFDTEDEVIDYANSTPYGLSATLWTENLTRAHRLAARVKSGIIWINCWLLRDLRTPFGGMKQSGVGREGGWEALRFFTEARNVCVKL